MKEPATAPTRVTEFKSKAREAGYRDSYSSIVTKGGGKDEPFLDYPEPKSYITEHFISFDWTLIP